MKGLRRVVDRGSVVLQYALWKIGISWHNTIRDECTPNFSCCLYKYPVGSEERYILGAIANGARKHKSLIPIMRFPHTSRSEPKEKP